MQKLLIFPFGREHVDLARNISRGGVFESVLPVAMKGQDFTGHDIAYLDCGEETGILISELYETELPAADAVFFDYDSNIDMETYREYIDLAEKLEKRIMISFGVEQMLHDIGYLSKIDKVYRYDDYRYELDEFKNLFRMRVPVIIILGMGEYTGKTMTQIATGDFFREKGYRVCEIGTKEYSELLGMNTLPALLFENKLSVEEKIIALNRFLYQKIESSECDLAIISMPGGIMPLNPLEFKDAGTLDFILSNAVKPDICILNFYALKYNRKFIEYLSNICLYKFGYVTKYFNMSSVVYALSPVEKEGFFYAGTPKMLREYLDYDMGDDEEIIVFSIAAGNRSEETLDKMLKELQDNIE